VHVNSPVDFLEQIRLSSERRIFKNNGINPHSSRSHHVFQIKIHTYDKMGKPCESLLNIVDLAGSERRLAALHEPAPVNLRASVAKPAAGQFGKSLSPSGSFNESITMSNKKQKLMSQKSNPKAISVN
jgi:hypothetical protein